MKADSESELVDDRHWLIQRRVRDYPRIFVALFVLTVPIYASTFEGGVDARGQAVGSDFIAFWSAARLAVDGMAVQAWDVYRMAEFQASVYPGIAPNYWAYPPTTLALVFILGYLAHPMAFVVWTAFGLAAFCLSLAPIIRRNRTGWWILAAFPGLWLGVAQGQTQFVVSALVGGALLLLGPRPILAGCLVGLLVIKPQLALLFPLALIGSRNWRAFTAAAVTAISFMFASVLAFGFESIPSWFGGMHVITTAVDAGNAPIHKFVSPYLAFRLMGIPGIPALLMHVVVATFVAWTVWQVWRRTTDIALRGSAFVLGTCLATPYAADYDLAMLAFPIAWLTLVGLRDGWLRGDRNLLVLAWLIPFLTAPIATVTHVAPAPIVVALLLWQVWMHTTRPGVIFRPPPTHPLR